MLSHRIFMVNFNMQICLFAFISIIICIESLHIKVTSNTLTRWLAKSVIVSTLLTTGLENSVHASIDAFDGAARAMAYKKERTVQDRAFDELPLAAKKRKALALCKDSTSRKAAGYYSGSECTNDVIVGNFRIVYKAPEDAKAATEEPAILKKIMAKSDVAEDTESTKPATKVNDFSDLSTAQKKRRALAACKKSDVRKYAKISSESKCSVLVNQGNFDSIIEALEYGL